MFFCYESCRLIRLKILLEEYLSKADTKVFIINYERKATRCDPRHHRRCCSAPRTADHQQGLRVRVLEGQARSLLRLRVRERLQRAHLPREPRQDQHPQLQRAQDLRNGTQPVLRPHPGGVRYELSWFHS